MLPLISLSMFAFIYIIFIYVNNRQIGIWKIENDNYRLFQKNVCCSGIVANLT